MADDALICGAIAKDALRKREMKKLNRIFKVLPPDQKKMVEGMKQQIVFMYLTLIELQEIIYRDGAIDSAVKNGEVTLREHPAAKTYNAMIKNYSSLCKQMLDMLPEKKNAEAADELMAFVKKAKR